MKKQIETRTDIELLINEFYTKAKADEVIGYIFTEVVELSWEIHMPIMYNFWETILLHSGNYRGGMMQKHFALDKKERLTPAHFARWKKLFLETVDTYFIGEKADEAKKRVELMSELMLFKVEQSRKRGFIQ